MVSERYWTDHSLEEYLGSFLEEHPHAAVSEIVYCPTEKRFQQVLKKSFPQHVWSPQKVGLLWFRMQFAETAMSVMYDINRLGTSIPAVIVGYPPTLLVQEDELVSIIRDHEYVHASDWSAGIPINSQYRITTQNKDQLILDTINAIMEVRAYEHQLEAMPLEWKERSIFDTISSNHSRHYQFLRSRLAAEDSSPSEKNIIQDFLRALNFSP
ncbi:hypothetical protein HY495_01765 [Candidatus Woesearchaeota archaeon]|nr:hypothetical protein [Candidatus Woesearchaeota archaeon]